MAKKLVSSRRRRLRVAHVTLGLDVGGQERLLVEFARHADRTRFELVFISLTGRGKLAGRLEELGWPVVTLEEGEGLRPRMVSRLVRIFQRHGCDIIHTHDAKPLLYSSLAVLLARAHRHIHSQHHGFLPQMTNRQRKMVAWAGRLADAFVCVSRDSARHVAQTGLPSERITTLYNGIDLERYAYQGPCPDGPAVTVARLSPEKDIATLLHAAALAVAAAPDFRLEIAGNGRLRSELRQLAATLGLEKHVRFLGEVRDIPGLLRRARLFVLPSRTEGISLTILEAMASGLPVLTTNVGGNPEILRCGTTGLLVPSANPAALANGLVELWSHPEDGRLMGCAGRRRVESHFDVRHMVKQYQRLYVGASGDGALVGDPGAVAEFARIQPAGG
jgi:glycosyltransferase involved in cell wall biosynthesis